MLTLGARMLIGVNVGVGVVSVLLEARSAQVIKLSAVKVHSPFAGYTLSCLGSQLFQAMEWLKILHEHKACLWHYKCILA